MNDPLRLLFGSVLAACLLLACLGSAACHAEEPPAAFYRGLNLHGPRLVIDGQPWEGQDAKDYVVCGQAFENQSVPLKPQTDRLRAQMLRSSNWGNALDIELTSVPAGEYQVFAYVWEDNFPTRFDVLVNGQLVVKQHDSGGAGAWARLGPWKVRMTDGVLKISARGGDANFSGIEVWKGWGTIPPPQMSGFSKPTPEQLVFFEAKIRPLLVQHCYECHSAASKTVGGSLLLDSKAGVAKGGDTEPPVVPGDPEASLLIAAVRHTDPGLKMPPKSKLSAAETGDLETWVKQGAPDPRLEDTLSARKKPTIDWDKAREFWSLRPVAAPPRPPVKHTSWPTGDLDRFVLARMEQEQLEPAGTADKRTLIRRATFDLIGLPPPPEEVDAFLQDTSTKAFANVVDRLLASPQYGERWGRHWLDVARYADTAGDNSDFPIPQMYKYRNWVISAFNRDLPYDQFIREQLAGDLLPGDTLEQKNERIIATGYIANARRFGSTVSDYPTELTIEDTIDNLGRAFLGTTISCARCHDHKFDAVTAEDYYALYGIFQSTRYPWPGIELEQKQRDLVPLASPAELDKAAKARQADQEKLNAEVTRLEQEKKSAQGEDEKKLGKRLSEAKDAAERLKQAPLDVEYAYAVNDAAQIDNARVQLKGSPAKLGTLVPRRFLTVLGGAELSSVDHSSGRAELANWIADPRNPLTARVLVNRVWLHHFGRGIVPTPNDFGHQGKPPTHPELLDWLAAKFMESGWSIKSLHRLVMNSSTYQMDSRLNADALSRDPTNTWLSASPRHRLDAEAIRDTLLVLGGNLDATTGGPHPFPPQSGWKFTQHNPFKAIYETNRRSVYLMTQRIQRHPYLAIFDGPDPSVSTPLRQVSTTPLQALFLLNDPFVHEQSRRFAARIIAAEANERARIELACRMAFARQPDAEEVDAAVDFLSKIREPLQAGGVPSGEIELHAWQAFARALFRMNEFVYVD